MYPNISIDELYQLIVSQAHIQVLDVRTQEEWDQFHIADPRVQVFPLSEILPKLNELSQDTSLYVICNSGSRSQMAQMLLARHDCSVINVQGGMQAWRKAGYPVESNV